MSFDAEEETELRDLVTSSLQTSGILGKIKAQLRSNVYLAIEGESELKKKSKHVNPKLDQFASTSEGRLAIQLIREFLMFFGLDYSLLVFEPEAMEGRNITFRDRDELIENLGFAETLQNVPLLSEVIKLSKISVLKSETPTQEESEKVDEEDTMEDLSEKSSISSSKTPQQQRLTSSNTTSQEQPKEFNATFTLNNEAKSMTETPPKSFLGDLPPLGGLGSNLGGGTKNTAMNLAPLKKIPPVAKVEATKKEEPKSKPTVEVKPNTSNAEPEAQSLSITEDIDEELDEFLNSSISASDDLTKEETVSDGNSLKADYVEAL